MQLNELHYGAVFAFERVGGGKPSGPYTYRRQVAQNTHQVIGPDGRITEVTPMPKASVRHLGRIKLTEFPADGRTKLRTNRGRAGVLGYSGVLIFAPTGSPVGVPIAEDGSIGGGEHITLVSRVVPTWVSRDYAIFVKQAGEWVRSRGKTIPATGHVSRADFFESALHQWTLTATAFAKCATPEDPLPKHLVQRQERVQRWFRDHGPFVPFRHPTNSGANYLFDTGIPNPRKTSVVKAPGQIGNVLYTTDGLDPKPLNVTDVPAGTVGVTANGTRVTFLGKEDPRSVRHLDMVSSRFVRVALFHYAVGRERTHGYTADGKFYTLPEAASPMDLVSLEIPTKPAPSNPATAPVPLPPLPLDQFPGQIEVKRRNGTTGTLLAKNDPVAVDYLRKCRSPESFRVFRKSSGTLLRYHSDGTRLRCSQYDIVGVVPSTCAEVHAARGADKIQFPVPDVTDVPEGSIGVCRNGSRVLFLAKNDPQAVRYLDGLGSYFVRVVKAFPLAGKRTYALTKSGHYSTLGDRVEDVIRVEPPKVIPILHLREQLNPTPANSTTPDVPDVPSGYRLATGEDAWAAKALAVQENPAMYWDGELWTKLERGFAGLPERAVYEIIMNRPVALFGTPDHIPFTTSKRCGRVGFSWATNKDRTGKVDLPKGWRFWAFGGFCHHAGKLTAEQFKLLHNSAWAKPNPGNAEDIGSGLAT